MVERTYIINDSGIRGRPAILLVSTVAQFTSEVILEYKERQVNLKSVMGVLSLGVPKRASIKVIAKGVDAVQAIEVVDQVMEKEEIGVQEHKWLMGLQP
ncbi:HPr family phosphocarrier protein [Halalkalibacter kiskunsagensis]|uniref:HPr family phosphocarrier protein n=1 Tax=Halalkalibacter kiskunsagensis TaxID=1548599 RepID=A0ABV6KDG2_9BACI